MMQLGFGLPVSGSWATPANVTRFATRAEELGYHSLWTFQRLLVPADPGARASAPVYRSVLDPVTALGYAAAVTSRVRLGVAIWNLPFTAPVVIAKQLTTLDVLSDGRLDAGFGTGWSKEEFTAAGVPFERRGARADEFLRALEAIWTQDVVAFSGDFYEIPPSRIEPKPVQRPRPPILLGGAAEPALRRAGRAADGWISSSRADLASIGDSVAIIRAAAAEAGRDPERVRAVVRGSVQVREAGDPGRRPLTGSIAEIKADLDTLAGQGVTEVFADLNFNPGIGNVEVDAATATARAEEILEALAPAPA
jgi:probable F420-dependent oxidoreductase